MTKNKLTKIYIVRHGQSQANVDGVVSGHFDSPLTATGEKRTGELASKFKNIHFDAIFSSDLMRAKRTAEIIAIERKIAVKTSRLLRERYFGILDGKKETDNTMKLFKKLESLSFKEWMKHRLVDGAETAEELISRFMTFLREVAVNYAGKTVLIVSHGSMMRSLLIHLGYATPNTFVHGMLVNNAYFVIETDGLDFYISETSWDRA